MQGGVGSPRGEMPGRGTAAKERPRLLSVNAEVSDDVDRGKWGAVSGKEEGTKAGVGEKRLLAPAAAIV